MLLLSYIKNNNIIDLINHLITTKRYYFLEAIFKEDDSIIDSFLLNYPLESFKKYINDFAEINFLWEYLVEKINNKETLHKNAQTIFYILLDRKIEKKELNDDEEKKFYSLFFNCIVASLEEKNNELGGDFFLIYQQRECFLNILYNTMQNNKKQLTYEEKNILLNHLCIDYSSFLLVNQKNPLAEDSLKKIVFIFLSLRDKNNIDEMKKFIDQLITLQYSLFNNILKENTEILNFLLKNDYYKKLKERIDDSTTNHLWKSLLIKIKNLRATPEEKELFYLLFEIKLKFDIECDRVYCFDDIVNAKLDYNFFNINNFDDSVKNYLCEEFCTQLMKNKVDYSAIMDCLWKFLLIKIKNPNTRLEEKELFYLLFKKRIKFDIKCNRRDCFNDIVNAELDYSFLNINYFDNSVTNYLCKEFYTKFENNQSLTSAEIEFLLKELSTKIKDDDYYNKLSNEYNKLCKNAKSDRLILESMQPSNVELFLDIFYHKIKTDRDDALLLKIVNDNHVVNGMKKCILDYVVFFLKVFRYDDETKLINNMLIPCFNWRDRVHVYIEARAKRLYKMYMCIFILFIKTKKFDFNGLGTSLSIFRYIREGYRYINEKDQKWYKEFLSLLLFNEEKAINVDFHNASRDSNECYFAYFKIYIALSFCYDSDSSIWLSLTDIESLTIGNVIKFLYNNKTFLSDTHIVYLIELLFLKLGLNDGSAFANSFMVPFLRADSLEKKKNLFKQNIFYFAGGKILTKYSFLPYGLFKDICIKMGEGYNWGLTYNDLTVLFNGDDYTDLFIDDRTYTDELRYKEMTLNLKSFLQNISKNILQWGNDNFLLNRIQSKRFVFLSLGSLLFGYKFKEKKQCQYENFIELLNKISLDNKDILTKKEFYSNILVKPFLDKYKDGFIPMLAFHCEKYKDMVYFADEKRSIEEKLRAIKWIDNSTNKIQSKQKNFYDQDGYFSLEIELNYMYDKDFFVSFLGFLFFIQEEDRKKIKNHYKKYNDMKKLHLDNDFYYSDICNYLLIGSFDCKGFLAFNEILKNFICNEIDILSAELLAAITKKYESLLLVSNLSNEYRESIYNILFIIQEKGNYDEKLFLEYRKKKKKEKAEADLIWKCQSLVTVSGLALAGSVIGLRMKSKQLESNTSWLFNKINSLSNQIKKIESRKFWAGIVVLRLSVLLCTEYGIPYLIKKNQAKKQ